MGGTRLLRFAVTTPVIFALGYVGMLGAESVEFRPARIVDAVVDTNNLAVGTAVHAAHTPEPVGFAVGTDLAPYSPGSPAPATTAPPVTTPPGAVTQSTTTTTATPPTTSTTVVPTTPPPPTPRQRGERALASFSYDWRNGLPGWEISFHPGREGVLGYTFVQEKRIEIYVRDQMSDPLLAHVVAHEVGHAIDVTLNSGDDRRRWQKQRGIDDRSWWPGNGATDFSTGAGDFAESFAAWQVGTAAYRSNLGAPPDQAAIALLAELVDG
ncbi:MAG: hypothetical protein ACN4GZ_15220 [Acidimicrobiales bacterium]